MKDGKEEWRTVSTLADAVLPLIRTRSDLYRYSAANAHGRDMHEAVDILEAAIPTTDPAEIYAVTHKALASSLKVIARAALGRTAASRRWSARGRRGTRRVPRPR